MDINLITVKQGRRAVDDAKVRELAQSMSEIGLINPITVTQGKVLITGAHRLEAAKLLGWTDIKATVSELDGLRAELAEIDENLMRNELHYIDRGNSIKRRCEILELLGLKATGGRPTKNQSESDEFLTNKELAGKMGVSETQFKIERQIATNILPEVQDAIKAADLPKTDALKIARLEPDEQLKVADRLNEGAKSYIDAKRLNRREEIHGTPELAGKYRVIYADPPWSYGDKLTINYGAAENHYPLMTISELCDMPVKDIADDNAILFMWVTSPLLEESFAVINAWGFKYKASFVWDKVKHNMGHYNSVRHEFLLIATKGSCQPENQKLFDSVVSEERTEHSAKPDAFRNIIETLYPSASKVELFARQQHEGWSVWGNQS
ncbi:MAG: MT-A70 family methyltransferase [Candidatus Sumerlaeales bacterium]|nr:MT-A70 family methyltransferase [Candidatus Sumerlaeales bacterium]